MINVIRPTWNGDPEQQRLLDAAIRAAQKADREEDAAWAAILRAREAGVPDTLLCTRTKRSRATLNRRYGPRADDTES